MPEPSRPTRATPAGVPPKLPEVASPPTEDVLESVPSTEEIVQQAESAEEILEQQPDVRELLGSDAPETDPDPASPGEPR